MRTDSVATATGRRGRLSQKIPRPNTRIRKIYDLFQTRKGEVVTDLPQYVNNSVVIEQLRNFYGLDIRNLARGKSTGRKKGGSKWILVGEWFGPQYVDYVANNKRKLAKVEKAVIKGNYSVEPIS
jgi:hypothetical protein